MNKSRKTAVLRHWFGVDRVLFGKPATSVLEGKELDQYLSTKGALLSNLYEMYQKIGFKDEVKYRTVAEMAKDAIKLAEMAKTKANSILNESSVLALVKEEVRKMGDIEGLSEQQVARYVVAKRRNAVALDTLMTEGVINKSTKESLSDSIGTVFVNAHKTLRDTLIDISLQ